MNDIKQIIADIKDARNFYQASKTEGLGVKRAKEKYQNILFTFADELLNEVDMSDALLTEFNKLVEENAKLKSQLESLNAPKAPKAKE